MLQLREHEGRWRVVVMAASVAFAIRGSAFFLCRWQKRLRTVRSTGDYADLWSQAAAASRNPQAGS